MTWAIPPNVFRSCKRHLEESPMSSNATAGPAPPPFPKFDRPSLVPCAPPSPFFSRHVCAAANPKAHSLYICRGVGEGIVFSGLAPAVAFDDMGDSSKCLAQLQKTLGGIAHVIERYGGPGRPHFPKIGSPQSGPWRTGIAFCRRPVARRGNPEGLFDLAGELRAPDAGGVREGNRHPRQFHPLFLR